MWQVLGAIMLIAAAIVAFQIAIILLILVGLIWRPKETIGLLIIVGMIALLQSHPALGVAALACLILLCWYGHKARKREEGSNVIDTPPPETEE